MARLQTYLDALLRSLRDRLSPDGICELSTWPLEEEFEACFQHLGEAGNEGDLTEREREGYTTYVHALDFMALVCRSTQRRLGMVTGS